MNVSEKPTYCVEDITIALAMVYKVGGKVEKIYIDDEFIGYGVLKDGELL